MRHTTHFTLFTASALALAATPMTTHADIEILISENYGSQDRVSRWTWGDFCLVNHVVGVGVTDLEAPYDIAIGPDGFLYVTSYGDDTVLRFHVDTGKRVKTTPFIESQFGGLDGPRGLAFRWDEATDQHLLLVSSYNTNEILQYDLGGNPLGGFGDPTALDGPGDLIVAADGSVYVCGIDSDAIYLFNPDGSPWNGDGVFVTPNSGSLNSPRGMAFSPHDDNLHVSSAANDRILYYSKDDGTYIDVFAEGNHINSPQAIAFGPDGDLYVANFDLKNIAQLDGEQGFLVDVPIDDDLVAPYAFLFVETCPADIDGDGEVGFADLLLLLNAWGVCPL